MLYVEETLNSKLVQKVRKLCLTAFALSLAAPLAVRCQDLSTLPLEKTYTQQRITSSDRTGGNDDGDRTHPIKPGETRIIGDVDGPGIITHMWFTIDSPERYHLKMLVLRMYWDNDTHPAVETPLGDFFGLGLGEYLVYQSGPISVGSQKALNSYFPMPFRKHARITLTNEGTLPTAAVYFNIDLQKYASPLPASMMYFYAEYRQAQPNKGWTDDWKANDSPNVYSAKNLDGKDNYVVAEMEGPGHYVGTPLSVLQNQGDWWGEGDEMMYIDQKAAPAITGTGSEDYFLGA